MINSIKNKLLFLKNPAFFSSIYYKIIILFLISFFWYLEKDFIDSHILIYNLIFLSFHYFLLNIIFNYGKLVLIYIYLKKNNLQTGYNDNLTVGIQRLSFFLNHFFFVFLVINVLIIDIKDLLTSLSIVAVAMVLIFKEYIANFLTGLNLMFSKDFRIKDTVKIGDSKGKIIDFTFHNVELKTETGDIIYIPNSNFLTKEITNFSKSSLKNIIIDFIILRKDISKFENEKKKFIEVLYSNFSDSIGNLSNISVYVNKLEKETVVIFFEINLTKYSFNIEKLIRTFILTDVGILFPNKSIKEKKD